MALNCCTYENLGCTPHCEPELNLGIEKSVTPFTVRLQFNGMTKDFEVATDDTGVFLLGAELFANNIYHFALFNALGDQVGCYKFETI